MGDIMAKKTIKEMIEVMKWFEGEGEVERTDKGYESWRTTETPVWNWDDYDYRIKEFQYPMWFKSTSSSLVVRFDNLDSGEVVVGNEVHKIGEYDEDWIEHTNKYHWEEIEEPIAKQKVTIEKWLVEDNYIKVVVEASDIDAWLKSFPKAKKIKLIESYEVEI
jgi:hypothetical protein